MFKKKYRSLIPNETDPLKNKEKNTYSESYDIIKLNFLIKANFTLSSFSRLILWGLLLLLLSPWIILIIRLEIWKKIVSKFEKLFLIKEEEAEQTKKMAYSIE